MSKKSKATSGSLEVTYRPVGDLIPYVNNSRLHSDKQVTQVASSIKEFGFTNPILIDEDGGIIAGHGRLMASQKLGMSEVPTITLEGLTEAQKKAYVIADNQLALNADWDVGMLKLELENLVSLSFDIDLIGFSDDELAEFMGDDEDSPEDNPYTDKVSIPTYEPSDEKPDVKDLYDDSYTFELVEKIKASNLPQEEKDFLMLAAGRHTILDFEKIADYYAHSESPMQALMEDNALVIVDIDSAIKNGWVKMSEKLDEQYEADNG